MAFPAIWPSEIRDHIEAVRRVPAYKMEYAERTRLAERVKAKETMIKRDTRHLSRTARGDWMDHLKAEKAEKETIDTDHAALVAHEHAMRERWKVIPPFPPPAPVPLDTWNPFPWINPFTGLLPVE